MRLLLVVALGCVLTLTPGCSDDGGGGGPDATGDGGGGGESAGQSSCPGCAAGQGCLEVRVTRVADGPDLPWILGPATADGVGTLVVGLKESNASGAKPVRRTVPAADFTDPSALYTLDLGCQPALAYEVRAFLDDNEDAGADAVASNDFHDACPWPRHLEITLTAGGQLKVDLELSAGCE